jgi:GntR family transcriptional regulator, rspAB operon transcriptional repressor
MSEVSSPTPAFTGHSSVRRGGASGTAFAWLRDEILSGRMRPGQALSENEIAQRLGVSRTPVREAIIRLESEGLLEVRPQVGTTVSPIDVDAVADVQFLREAIECRTVALAARSVSTADARELRARRPPCIRPPRRPHASEIGGHGGPPQCLARRRGREGAA